MQFTGADGVPFDATLILSRPGERAPGVLFLHGGPHSAYPAAYLHALAFLANLGYNLVVPNYRCVHRATPQWLFPDCRCVFTGLQTGCL